MKTAFDKFCEVAHEREDNLVEYLVYSVERDLREIYNRKDELGKWEFDMLTSAQSCLDEILEA